MIQRFKLKQEPTLTEAQAYVGGWVQMITLNNGDAMLMNEEGKLHGLPVNVEATTLWEKSFGPTDVVVGNVMVIAKRTRKNW